ncbi:MAG TPA: MMPL family transporter, partial [Candidatus Limnocylindrales bacterium]|nr:MMPL family transporter [Candidatus Limnocylindrales bacterium]
MAATGRAEVPTYDRGIDRPSPSPPSPDTPRSVFEQIGRFAYRRRWWVVGAWVLVLLAAAPFAPRVAGALRAGGFSLGDLESARASALLEQELGIPPSAVVVILRSETEQAGSLAFETSAAAATANLATAPHVVGIRSHLLAPSQVSADGHVAYDVALLDLSPDDSPEALPGIEAALRHPPGIDVELAGGPAFYGDVQSVSESDLRRSELISLPLAAIALLLVFGSVVSAGVPLVVGGSAVVVALALIWAVASITPMSIFVLNLATLLGLGLGVDYSLLLTSRFREELAANRHAADAGTDA